MDIFPTHRFGFSLKNWLFELIKYINDIKNDLLDKDCQKIQWDKYIQNYLGMSLHMWRYSDKDLVNKIDRNSKKWHKNKTYHKTSA